MSQETKTSDASNDTSNDLKNSEEYAYLDRGGFSSENFKIEVRNLPKFYGIAELKKLMNEKLDLKVSKIKRPKNGSHWLYACFQDEDSRIKAIAALNGFSWKGKSLKAEIAKPAPDPLFRKRKQVQEGNDNEKKKKEDNNRTPEERLKDATTPYWNIDYEEQLKLKEKEIRKILMTFDNDLWKMYITKRDEIEKNRKVHNGLSFELRPIERSPVIDGYRNKCEFTVGFDLETGEPTVGFRHGTYAAGTIAVGPIQSQVHISEETKKAVLIIQDFVRKSDIAPFSPADYSGHWKYLAVRQSKLTGDLMLVIAMHPKDLSVEEIDKIKTQLKEHLSTDECKACGIKSVYFETISKKRSGQEASKPVHLLGDTHIVDSILGLRFRISPLAFFQINTAAADVLYQTAIDLSEVKSDSSVVDICCGTGSIGLCFAKHCDNVLGLEMVAEAVEDARANARLNQIENAQFYAGRAEDVLPSVLARATDDVVAIVDPPRAGLHMRAVTQLRNTKKVKRLIYISCSPASAVKNLVDLCRPSSKTLHGAPFVAVRAIPVDMFPHTKHCELVILFEREQKSTEAAGDSSETTLTVGETTETKTEMDVNNEHQDDTQNEPAADNGDTGKD